MQPRTCSNMISVIASITPINSRVRTRLRARLTSAGCQKCSHQTQRHTEKEREREWQLTSCPRCAGQHNQHAKHQMNFSFHLSGGRLPPLDYTAALLCGSLGLFPLRDLTGHIMGSKNILRESGRREAGVGLDAGGVGGWHHKEIDSNE